MDNAKDQAPAQPRAFDILEAAQDTLLERLLCGRISSRNLNAAYRLHLRTLTGAGFKAHEAASCFWDALHTADATRRHESTKSAAA